MYVDFKKCISYTLKNRLFSTLKLVCNNVANKEEIKVLNLKKYPARELTSDIAYKMIKELEDALYTHRELDKDEISTIINMQDDDGSFRLFTGQWCYDSDAILDVDHRVTYLSTLLLINNNPDEETLKVIGKAFDFIEKRGLHGKGYSAGEDELKNITLFLEYGIKKFLNQYVKNFNKFIKFFNFLVTNWESQYSKGRVVIGWGEDVTDQVKHILELYHK